MNCVYAHATRHKVKHKKFLEKGAPLSAPASGGCRRLREA
jgi:hypothetical protein